MPKTRWIGILAAAPACALARRGTRGRPDAARLAPVPRRQGRRARRHGADDRQGRQRPRTSGLTIQVYPGASLFKPNDQWNAMVNGQLDMTLFPLDYASGKVPAFSATLMPGLIRSQERAKRINKSKFMKEIRAEIEKHGVIVLSDAWFAGGMAAKGNCVIKPADMKGTEVPRGGPDLRGDVGVGGREHREPAVQRDLQRLPERRRERHRHEPRHVRLDAPRRGGRLPPTASHMRVIENLMGQRHQMDPPPVRAISDQFASNKDVVAKALMSLGGASSWCRSIARKRTWLWPPPRFWPGTSSSRAWGHWKRSLR